MKRSDKELRVIVEEVLGPLTITTVGIISKISFRLGQVIATGTAVGYSPEQSSILLQHEISAIQLIMTNIDYFRNL